MAAVRELVETLLRARGQWQELTARWLDDTAGDEVADGGSPPAPAVGGESGGDSGTGTDGAGGA